MQKGKSYLLMKCLGIFFLFVCFSMVMASDPSTDPSLSHKRSRTTKMELQDMTELNRKADLLKSLHVKGDPLVLYNAWDAGSAKAIRKSGAKAIATSSWSVAAAQGYEDGEQVPLDAVLTNIERIVSVSGDVPVTLDFEGGYTGALGELRKNIRSVIEAGVVGINFEDQVVGGTDLYSINEQCDRIRAIREEASSLSIPLFINARSDVFFKSDASTHNESQLAEAITRARSYAEAGADGFFVPGLNNPDYIKRLCEASPIPVNIMVNDSGSLLSLAELGVARISYGPFSYIPLMTALEQAAAKVYAKA